MINKKYLFLIPLLAITFFFGVNYVKAYEMNEDDLIVSGSYNSSQCQIYFSQDEQLFYYYGRTKSTKPWTVLGTIPYNSSYFYIIMGSSNYLQYQRTCVLYYFTSEIYIDNYINNGSTYYSLFSNSSGSYYFYSSTTGSSLSPNGSQTNYNSGLVVSNGGSTMVNNSSDNYSTYLSWNIYDNTINSYPYENKVLDIFNTIPTIDITTSNNYDNDAFSNNYLKSVSATINFSSFNSNSYSYWYKFNSDVWVELEENEHTINLNKNGTLYVKVQDSSNNIVASATHTVTTIKSPPTIEHGVNMQSDKTGMIYNDMIKIPLSYLYDSSNNKWVGYKLIFLSKSIDDITSDFYITMDNLNYNNFPLDINFIENVDDISDTNNLSSFNDFVTNNIINASSSINGCNKINFPYEYTIYNDDTNYYNILYLNIFCVDQNSLPSDYENEYIYIFFNARVYESLSSLVDDYNNNTDNYNSDNEKSIYRYLENALGYFKSTIANIFKLITYFFNRMPVQFRYAIISAFVLLISLMAFRFML